MSTAPLTLTIVADATRAVLSLKRIGAYVVAMKLRLNTRRLMYRYRVVPA